MGESHLQICADNTLQWSGCLKQAVTVSLIFQTDHIGVYVFIYPPPLRSLRWASCLIQVKAYLADPSAFASEAPAAEAATEKKGDAPTAKVEEEEEEEEDEVPHLLSPRSFHAPLSLLSTLALRCGTSLAHLQPHQRIHLVRSWLQNIWDHVSMLAIFFVSSKLKEHDQNAYTGNIHWISKS